MDTSAIHLSLPDLALRAVLAVVPLAALTLVERQLGRKRVLPLVTWLLFLGVTALYASTLVQMLNTAGFETAALVGGLLSAARQGALTTIAVMLVVLALMGMRDTPRSMTMAE